MKFSEIQIDPIKISILVLSLLIIYYLGDFSNTILASLVIYILSRPMLFYLIDKRKMKPILATILIISLSVIIFLLPLTLISLLLSSKINYIVNNYSAFLAAIQEQLQVFLSTYKIQINTGEIIQKAASFLGDFAPKLVNATANTITQLTIMYFCLFFMLKDNRKFESWILSFSPFSKTKTHMLLLELKSNIYGSSIGIPVLGIVQAIVALIGYLIFGVDEPLLWAILTGLFSVIPIVGTTIIWLPVSLYLIITGDPIQGTGLLAYSVLIITNVDNVVRFLLLKKYGDIHPLITIFGLILGLRLFGFLGIILGPLVLSYLFLLLDFTKFKEPTESPSNNEADTSDSVST